MTPGLIISRNSKIKIHALSVSNPKSFLAKYKQYHNIYNSLLRASKKLHYERKFVEHAKNPKKTWQLLNELTLGNSKTAQVSKLNVNGNILDQPKDIANEFNNFFSTAGQNIA
jgi:hypothetical protein